VCSIVLLLVPCAVYRVSVIHDQLNIRHSIGLNFLGAFVYADDIVLLAPTPLAIRKFLNICDDYVREYSIIFNGKKSKCIFYPGSKEVGHASMAHMIPSLQVGGSDIEYVDSLTHLGNILSSDCRNDKDIEHRRVQTVKQISDLLSYFGKLDAIVKLQLLYSYCSSLYGSELWDLSCSAIEVLCVSWRRALKNVWKLPLNTHGNLIYALSCVRPIKVQLKCRVLNFVLNCLNSDVGLVRSLCYTAHYFFIGLSISDWQKTSFLVVSF